MLLILLDYYIVIIIMIHIMLYMQYDKKNLPILTTTVTTMLPAGY